MIFSLILVGGIFWIAQFYIQITGHLPSIETLPLLLNTENGLDLQPTGIYDRTGDKLLYVLKTPGVERHFLPLDSSRAGHFSAEYIKASVALLEPDYWTSSETDWANFFNPVPATIAERLVQDIFLTAETPDIAHVIRLKLLAAQVSQRYGKSQVLEWYLNSQYFGHFAYGADNAARLYLGKSAGELNLAESAYLLAVAGSPGLNPIDSPASALEGQRKILQLWLTNKFINIKEFDSLLNQPITLAAPPKEIFINQPAYVNLVLRQAEIFVPQSQLERGAMKIISTLDEPLQNQLTCTLQQQLQLLEGQSTGNENGAAASCAAAALLPALPPMTKPLSSDLQASALILDLPTGEILALSGDSTLGQEGAHLAMHNPGTLLTPFVALAGFERGLSPSSLVWDIPASLPPLAAGLMNNGTIFHGPVSLRSAVSNDYLAPFFKLLDQYGPETVWQVSEPLGMHLSPSTQDPLLYLNSGSKVSIVDAARAYSTLANQGNLVGQVSDNHGISPNGVIRVEDGFGRILLERKQPLSKTIVSSPLVYLVNSILSDDVSRRETLGYPNNLDVGRPAAVKIGQVENLHDVWTIGYSPQRLVAAWVGVPDGGSSEKLDYHASAGIWNALMQFSHRDLPLQTWAMPAGITTLDVCSPSGELPTQFCPAVVKDVFLSGSEPGGYDTLYRQFSINRETGRLATIFTPIDLIDQRVFMVPPPEALAWLKTNGRPVPPDTYDNIQVPAVQTDVNIREPAMFGIDHGVISIKGSADGAQFNNYHLEAGKGLNPSSWQQLQPQNNTAVKDGLLGRWDTTHFEDGLYVLRLTVIKNDQTVKTAISQITIDNTPPVIKLLKPQAGQIISDPLLNMTAEASDEVGISRLDWYIDGTLVSKTTAPPFLLAWTTSPGVHTLLVKAVDLAGNESTSAQVTFTVIKPQ